MGFCRIALVGGLMWALGAQAAALPGRVVDSLGAAVPDAVVWAAYRGVGAPTITPAKSGADGAFALDVPARTGAELDLRVFCRVPGRGCVARAGLLEAKRLDLRLTPGAPLSGVVVDIAKHPLTGATAIVRALAWPDGGWLLPAACVAELTATSDASGAWRIDTMPTDVSRSVAVSADGLGLSFLSLSAGYQVPGLTYSRLVPACRMKGRLVGPDGQPVPGVTMECGQDEATSAADGTFVLGHIVAQSARALCRTAGWREKRGPMVPTPAGGTADLGDVRLDRTVLVRGKIVGQTDGLPKPRRVASLTSESRESFTALADEQGAFALYVAPGRYQCAVTRGNEGVSMVSKETPEVVVLDVPADGQVPAVVVKAPPQPSHAFVFRDDKGQPMPRATVWCAESSWGKVEQGTTDDQGVAQWPVQMIERPFELRFWLTDPWRIAACKVSGKAGERYDVALPPRALTTVAGTVLDDARQPVVGAQVVLRMTVAPWVTNYRPGPEPVATTTDAKGAFAFAGVPADWSGDVVWTCDGYRGGAPLRLAKLGEAQPLALTMESLRGTARGVVVDAAGKPVAGAVVYAEGYLNGPPATTGADGRFVVDQLPAKPLAVVALAGPRALARANCTPPADNLRLAPEDTPPARWTDAPTEKDLNLVRDLASRAAGQGLDVDRWASLLAQADPNAALDRLEAQAKGRDRDLQVLRWLRQLPAGTVLGEEVLTLVNATGDGPQRAVIAGAAAARVRSTQVLARLLAVIRAVGPNEGAPHQQMDRAVSLAALALCTDSPTAKDDVAALVALCRRDPKAEFNLGMAVQGNIMDPRLVQALVEALPASPALDAAKTTAVLATLAKDARAGLDLARRYWPGPDGGLQLPSSSTTYGTGSDELLPRLVAAAAACSDAAAASRLAGSLKTPNPTFKAYVAAIAGAKDAASAGVLLQASADTLSFEYPASSARRILAAAQWGPELAAQARIDALARTGPIVLGPSSPLDRRDPSVRTLLDLAYSLALTEPNTSRLILESLYTVWRDSGRPMAPLVVAFATVDRSRAVRLAHGEGAIDADRLALAQWLAADAKDRCLMPVPEMNRL